MEADRIEILATYPLAKEYLKDEPDDYELTVVFGRRGDNAKSKMTDADKKIAASARKAPVVEGYPVLGKVTVTEPGEIKALLGSMRTMAIAWDDDGVTDEDCHDPRHALRVTKDGRTIHFSICFDCGNTYIRGLPEAAKAGKDGFHHFKDEMRDVLEKKLDKEGVFYLRPPSRQE